MILLRALPIYLRSLARRFSDDDMGIVALTYNRLCDVAGVEVAERVFLATPEGGDVVEDMQKAIEAAAKKPVPGHVVTQSLRDRGLRVGMTYQEVRANKWTECESESLDRPGFCTPQEPCSACKFLDGVLCKCGEPFPLHSGGHGYVNGGCGSFSLASWTPDSDGLTYREEPPVVYKTVDADSQTKPIYKIGEVADVSEHKKETDMTDTNATTTTKKPRIDRKTWHETVDGATAVKLVRDVLESKPPRSYYARELAPMTGLDLSVVGLALDRLILTGYADQHGKAKGTRYAHAGFMAWPAPTPRNRKSNEPPVSEADAEAAHSLDASDSEET
jgi:hypothetical protein